MKVVVYDSIMLNVTLTVIVTINQHFQKGLVPVITSGGTEVMDILVVLPPGTSTPGPAAVLVAIVLRLLNEKRFWRFEG